VSSARAASVEEAIAAADAVVFAVLARHDQGTDRNGPRAYSRNKVVVDPSNPLGFDESGQMIPHTARRTVGRLGGRRSAPRGRATTSRHSARLAADSPSRARQIASPRQAVLFYATDDDAAATNDRTASFMPQASSR